uniref:RING-type domain-containing protein n=1 Tax=Callorhinchus milii TaxID=7868 RepID=A0A4W3HBK4_CALMI
MKQFVPERLRMNMASRHQVQGLTEELKCAICLDFFTDPVSLGCGHNYCRSCITRSTENQKNNSCPECRQDTAERNLKRNLREVQCKLDSVEQQLSELQTQMGKDDLTFLQVKR